jgi:hypothetical protein
MSRSPITCRLPFATLVIDSTDTVIGSFFEQQLRSGQADGPWERILLPWDPVIMPADLVADPYEDRFFFQLSNRIWWFDGLEYAGETRPSFGDQGHMAMASSRFTPGTIYAAGKMQVGVDVKRATYDLPTAGGDHYTNWISLRDGLPETQVPSPANQTLKYNLEAAPSVPKLYLSVLGLGLFEREIEVEISSAPQHVTRLHPWVSFPAPNPTGGVVQWSLQLDEAQPIGISIVDAGGRVRFQSRLWRSDRCPRTRPGSVLHTREAPSGRVPTPGRRRRRHLGSENHDRPMIWSEAETGISTV